MLGFLTRLLAALVIGAFALAAPAAADDDGERDHDQRRREVMREAVERGEIKPLSEVLTIVRPKLSGEIVGVEIEVEGRSWIYEFRVVDKSGNVIEAYVDAATGEIVKIEEK